MGCACGYNGNCADPSMVCNCDMDDATPREDSGYIDEPQKLPLTATKAQDTDGEADSNIIIHPVEVSNRLSS